VSIGLGLVKEEGRQPREEETNEEPDGQEEQEEAPPKEYAFAAQTWQLTVPDEDHVPSVEDRVRVTVDIPEYPGPQIQV